MEMTKFSLSALSYLASPRKGNILTPGDTMFFLAKSLIRFSTGGLANLSLLKMDFEYFHLHTKSCSDSQKMPSTSIRPEKVCFETQISHLTTSVVLAQLLFLCSFTVGH